MIRFFNAFVKLTGYLPQKLVFRLKFLYEDPAAQRRRIRGPAIVVMNHTSVYDYAALLFTFFWRTLRVQMAELLFDKKPLGWFLRGMGGIRVDRSAKNFDFIAKSEAILARGGVVGIFPESRLPREGEARPLPFTPSAAYLALSANAPVIPLYTNGAYFSRERAVVAIGRPLLPGELADETLSEKENIDRLTRLMRESVMALGRLAEADRVNERE